MSIRLNSFCKSAEIYSDTTRDQWSELCGSLSNNALHEVYFHYCDYVYQEEYFPNDLLIALRQATDLQSIKFKDSSFNFVSRRENGLGILLDSLHSHQNLKFIQIRNYASYDLEKVFENLVALIENNKSIKKLSLNYLTIDSKKFKLLCELLSKPEVELELNLEDSTVSEENQILLRHALQSNPSIKVSHVGGGMFEAVAPVVQAAQPVVRPSSLFQPVQIQKKEDPSWTSKFNSQMLLASMVVVAAVIAAYILPTYARTYNNP